MTFLTSLRAHPLGRDNDVLITYLGIEVLSRMVIALSERVVAFFLEGVCQIGHYCWFATVMSNVYMIYPVWTLEAYTCTVIEPSEVMVLW